MGGRSARYANQALKIRMAKYGCTNRPFYHLVVAKTYRARDNKPIDQIGTYDPLPNTYNEKLVSINFEKLHMWLNKGARPSKPVELLLGLSGFLPVHPMSVIQAKRNLKQQQEADQAAADDETREDSTAV